ncbi:MAG: TetR/AcrR family transcriptional regulator [Spirochaetaceae bacterium]|nr:MAG: TetR/AcrR family transcriptional regulator [Spirochaetaceae bacterium]
MAKGAPVVAGERRTEILAVAERLFYEHGYDHTSIAQIIEEVGIAKGTFYHHFSSKAALVEGLVQGLIEQMLPAFEELARRSDISPVQRLQGYFDINSGWKSTNVELMVTTITALYRPENALLLRRISENSLDALGPYFNAVIVEGVEAGVFDAPRPERFGEFIMGMLIGIAESRSRILVESIDEPSKLYDYADMISILELAINRLLGVPEKTITLGAEQVLGRIRVYLEQRGA